MSVVETYFNQDQYQLEKQFSKKDEIKYNSNCKIKLIKLISNKY